VSQPDLFVVCKNCGSEVSPYVTECPYCGQRVRKRAPKIDKPGTPEEERPRRRRPSKPRLSRLRPDEIEGIAPDRRPYGTGLLIAVSVLLSVVQAAGLDPVDLGALVPGIREEVWRLFTAPFGYDLALGYQFVCLLAIGVFGSLLERRFGPLVPVLVGVLAGAAGAALALYFSVPPVLGTPGVTVVAGGNGMALGLLVAWLVDDRLAARRGEEREADMIGVAVFAAVLALISVPVEEANPAAAVGGAAAGGVLGLALRPLARRG